MQIRLWSEDCMRKIGQCNLNRILYAFYYDLLIRVQEIEGTEEDLYYAKNMTCALLFKGTTAVIIAQKKTLQAPDSGFKNVIVQKRLPEGTEGHRLPCSITEQAGDGPRQRGYGRG